jgi:polyhydroxybutyrate depolymerase
MAPRSLLIVLALIATACGSNGSESADLAEFKAAATTRAAVVEDSRTEAADTAATEDDAADGDDNTSVVEDTETTTTAAVEEVVEPREVRPPLQVNCSTLGPLPVGLQTGVIQSGGLEYQYQWTVPSIYDGTPLAVVLDFHAVGSNGAQQAVFSGWAALAEAEGFLAVEPTGVSIPPDDRPSWELPQFGTDERDDVEMVLDLLDHVAANVCIDPNQVYSTGMSNGALFTSTLVCELGARIAAAVSVAGVTHHGSCTPTRPVPYLAFHGTADTVIPFRGGGETTLEGGGEDAEFFEQVMPDEFAEFANDFGCTESSDSAVSELVTLTAYSGCDADTEMGFYTIDEGGHTWPGSIISSAIPTLGVTNLDVDATAIAWEFFQRHSL